jgi:hypothetical protein
MLPWRATERHRLVCDQVNRHRLVARGGAHRKYLLAALGASWCADNMTPAASALAADVKTPEQLHAIQLEILLARRDRIEEAIFNQEQTLKRVSDADIARRLQMVQDQLVELNTEITALRSGH